MAITKDKKREILATLTGALKEATSVAFIGFNKLTVADASKLRKELAKAGVRYYVAKKTLLRLALKARGYEGEVPELPGEVAIAWTAPTPAEVGAPTASVGADSTAPAREVYNFGKKLKGALTLLGGVFEGAFLDMQKMTAIAMIPPMQVLHGMFANVINSPLQRFASALSEVAKTKS